MSRTFRGGRLQRVLSALGVIAPALAASLLALGVTPSSGTLASGTTIALDLPANGRAVDNVLDVAGWAIDTAGSEGTGIDRVSIVLNDTYVKDAIYGQPRADIGAAFGQRFAASGFQASLDAASHVPPGEHVLEIRAHTAAGDTWSTLRRPIQVTSGPRFCINAHLMWFGAARAAVDLDRARANGLTAVRFDVSWDALEPAGAGDLSADYLAKLDAVLALVGERGLRPIITLLRTPAWARSGGTAFTPPDDPRDYANAAAFLAARYAHLPGMTYEIWNEPNSPVFWTAPDGPDPTVYARLLRTAYAQIKAAAPQATVLGGSVVFNEPQYLARMLTAGGAGAFDGLAIHPYSRGYAPDDALTPSRSFSLALTDSEDVLASAAPTDTPIWITEMGWSTALVDDGVRAEYFRRAVDIVRANPRIAAFCAFELNQGDDSAGPQTGLIAVDGTATASWDAYGRAVRGE